MCKSELSPVRPVFTGLKEIAVEKSTPIPPQVLVKK